MVFISTELGEHSITTRDIDVNENTIIQFEVQRLFFITNHQITHSAYENQFVIPIFLVYICLCRSMWAAQLKALLLTRCVLSFHETLVPRGTFWSPCALVDLNPPHFAPQSFTLLAFISLVLVRAGGGRSFTLASFASVGKDYKRLVQPVHK